MQRLEDGKRVLEVLRQAGSCEIVCHAHVWVFPFEGKVSLAFSGQGQAKEVIFKV